MYDITLTGSIVQAGNTIEDAHVKASVVSKVDFPGRLIRIHGVDGETVIAEYRNGLALELA